MISNLPHIMSEVEEYLFAANLAERTGRYKEMALWMKKVIDVKKGILTSDERNILFMAYRNILGQLKPGWRMIRVIELKGLKYSKDMKKLQIIEEFRMKIEMEISEVLTEFMNIIDNSLLRTEGLQTKDKVLYYKTKGDFCRYQVDYCSDNRPDYIERTNDAYKQAMCLLEADGAAIPPSNHTRLSLSLQYSLFLYEVYNKQEEACELSKNAYEDARTEVVASDIEVPNDTQCVMVLLRDNVILWQSHDAPANKAS